MLTTLLYEHGSTLSGWSLLSSRLKGQSIQIVGIVSIVFAVEVLNCNHWPAEPVAVSRLKIILARYDIEFLLYIFYEQWSRYLYPLAKG